jgi:hypothetical protein
VLQQEFGIRGPMAVAPHLESTIQPVVLVAQPPSDEWTNAPEIRRFSVPFDITSDASHPPFFELFCGAGMLLRVVYVAAWTSTFTLALGYVTSLTAGGIANPPQALNRRVTAPCAATAQNFGTAAVPANGKFALWDPAATDVLMWDQPILLSPSSEGLFLGCLNGTTQTLRGYVIFEEMTASGER